MAQGFIEDTTLTAIADAIRAKGGTSAEMLPNKMAELISGIKTSNATRKTGTFTPSSTTKTVSLGVSLDLSSNYCLFIIATDTDSSLWFHGGYTCMWNGSKTSISVHSDNNTDVSPTATNWTLTASGNVTLPEKVVASNNQNQFNARCQYQWLFITG